MKKTIKYKGKHLRFVEALCEDGVYWEFVERNNKVKAVSPIVYYNGDSVVIIKEFRHSIEKFMYSFPAGLIDEGEKAVEAGIREFEEETQFKFSDVGASPVSHGSTYSNVGISDEQITFMEAYLYTLEPGDKTPEASETIEAVVVPLKDLWSFLWASKESGEVEVSARLMAYAIGLKKGLELNG